MRVNSRRNRGNLENDEGRSSSTLLLVLAVLAVVVIAAVAVVVVLLMADKAPHKQETPVAAAAGAASSNTGSGSSNTGSGSTVPFPVAPVGYKDYAGDLMTLTSTAGMNIFLQRQFGGCIWEMSYRNQRYTQPLWGRGGSFQTAMCCVPQGDSCERWNPTMAGAADDAGGSKSTSVVLDFKISPDGTSAFVRTQAAYYYHSGSPVGSDPQRRPPLNTAHLSPVFMSWHIQTKGSLLVLDIGIDVTEPPPVGGGQVEVATNYMPPVFSTMMTWRNGALVMDGMKDRIEALAGPQQAGQRRPNPVGVCTADGRHCQGIFFSSRSDRGTHFNDYRLGGPPGTKETPFDPPNQPLRFGRPAYGGDLTKWTSTWHESGEIKMKGRYAWRLYSPLGTVGEVSAALNKLLETV